MTPSSDLRASLAQNIGSMRGILDRVVGLDYDTTLSRLDPVIRERLASPRIMPRLAMRRARKIAATGLFAGASGEREEFILSASPSIIEDLTIRAGTHALWEEVIRIVQRQERDSLDAELRITARDTALRGRAHGVGIVPVSFAENEMPLHEKILHEGALCWACWISGQTPVSARRLRVLTPEHVSKRIAAGMAGSPESRKKRRIVVDLELDELMRISRADRSDGGTEDDR